MKSIAILRFCPYRATSLTDTSPGRCPGLCAVGLTARIAPPNFLSKTFIIKVTLGYAQGGLSCLRQVAEPITARTAPQTFCLKLLADSNNKKMKNVKGRRAPTLFFILHSSFRKLSHRKLSHTRRHRHGTDDRRQRRQDGIDNNTPLTVYHTS